MNIAVWIVSGMLAAAYLFAGTNKATRPKDKLVDSLPWAEDFRPETIKFIGIMEILGALGLILPWMTGIAPVLNPLAATGTSHRPVPRHRLPPPPQPGEGDTGQPDLAAAGPVRSNRPLHRRLILRPPRRTHSEGAQPSS